MSLIYLVFIALTVYYSFRYDGIEEQDTGKRHRLWLMCAFLVLLSGFSYGLGADKFVYMYEFEEYPDDFSNIPDYIEFNIMLRGEMPLWTIVNSVCKIVFDSFYAVQLLESLAINVTVCYLVTQYTHRYFLFLLVYFLTLQFFVFNTEVMREGFSLAFVLLGMHGWMTGRKWLYFVTLPIGILFHISTVTVLLFPFAKVKLSWKTLIIATLVTFLIWLFSDVIFGKIVNLIFGGEGAFTQKLMFYAFQATPIFGYLRAVLTYLVFPFIMMYTLLLMETDEDMRRRKEKIMSFMVWLAILASSFAGFSRFYNYVQIFYLISLADFLYVLFSFKKHFVIRLGTVAGIFLINMMLYFAHYQSTDTYFYEFFYPYTCIADEDADVAYRPIAHAEATTVIADEKNTRNIE